MQIYINFVESCSTVSTLYNFFFKNNLKRVNLMNTNSNAQKYGSLNPSNWNFSMSRFRELRPLETCTALHISLKGHSSDSTPVVTLLSVTSHA